MKVLTSMTRKLVLTPTVWILLLSPLAQAQEMTVGVANLLKYLDPGQDHSNVGSQIYHNSFDSLIRKDPTQVEPTFCLAWRSVGR